ncbi:AEC family transporter [Chitinimonas sp. BJYL2]|uniref:AEC family transporter n=1 Tax=Chitinimonas sp. BJYL2 TaxID=2976696 RepID=UPI0022B3E43D|nr:AEC family transporter [Chitinimonas sp. BJYL2]
MLLRILGIITPILLVSLAGYLYARLRKPDLTEMNRLTVDLLAPLLIFAGLTSKHFDLWESRWLLLGGTAVILGSGLISVVVARVARESVRTLVPPMMFNNAAFMGLPLVLLALGPERLPAAVALFVVSTLLHMTIGVRLVNPHATLGYLAKNPLLIASVAGIACNLGGVVLPEWLSTSASLLGNAAIPLMLFSLGARMVDVHKTGWQAGVLGAVLCPLSGLAVAWPMMSVLPLQAVEISQLLMFAALPPAVLNFLIAERYQQEPDKVASIVLLGNIASLIFVPLGLALALSA